MNVITVMEKDEALRRAREAVGRFVRREYNLLADSVAKAIEEAYDKGVEDAKAVRSQVLEVDADKVEVIR